MARTRSLADAARYPAHFRGKVLPQLQAIDGFVGAISVNDGLAIASSSWC